MDRREIARQWQWILKHPPSATLEASGKLLRRAHAYDDLPQPGFVGRHYRQGKLLILGLNPAAGGDGLSSDDLIQYKLLEALRDTEKSDLIVRFESAMDHLVRFMPRWKIIENNGINAILSAHRMSMDDVAYLNVCKWRTSDSKLSFPILDEGWMIAGKQVSLLRPGRTLVLGKGLWDWYKRRHYARGDVCIPRMRGDRGLASAAVAVVSALKGEPLLPG